jgi:hypothetical protein
VRAHWHVAPATASATGSLSGTLGAVSATGSVARASGIMGTGTVTVQAAVVVVVPLGAVTVTWTVVVNRPSAQAGSLRPVVIVIKLTRSC